jgi:hypothetical protein
MSRASVVFPTDAGPTSRIAWGGPDAISAAAAATAGR